jgi:hypothetical protein
MPLQATCIRSAERQEAQCIATFWLRGGQGSGEYEGAEGEIQVQPVSQDSGIHTFHLKD